MTTADEMAIAWNNRDCPHHGRADICDYAGGVERFEDATEFCACGKIAFLDCDMTDGQGLCVFVPHSAIERPVIHTTDRCADAVDWPDGGDDV